jgi:hypothetical protein
LAPGFPSSLYLSNRACRFCWVHARAFGTGRSRALTLSYCMGSFIVDTKFSSSCGGEAPTERCCDLQRNALWQPTHGRCEEYWTDQSFLLRGAKGCMQRSLFGDQNQLSLMSWRRLAKMVAPCHPICPYPPVTAGSEIHGMEVVSANLTLITKTAMAWTVKAVI